MTRQAYLCAAERFRVNGYTVARLSELASARRATADIRAAVRASRLLLAGAVALLGASCAALDLASHETAARACYRGARTVADVQACAEGPPATLPAILQPEPVQALERSAVHRGERRPLGR